MLAYPMTIVAYSIDVLPKKPMLEMVDATWLKMAD